MAYQVLARKYRPLRFADVVGQDHVTRTLLNALAGDRIAHGYIFSGHRGIGKTTIARILASALNCQRTIGSEARSTAEPCLTCDSCLEIRTGNAVDVLEIDAATNRGIDEIRELRDAARYSPARDRFKIIILDEAHQITDAAFNALLKTLEEPPAHIVFMMATTQPEDIPQTIRSRCQHFSFHAVKLDDIVGQLRKISGDEHIDVDDATLGLLAEAGDGSMRDALSIMDQAIASAPQTANGRPHVELTEVRELMGAVSNVVFEDILGAVHANDSAAVLHALGNLLDAGNGPQSIARQFVRFLRNCVVAKITNLTPDADATGLAAELLQISTEERRRAARAAANFSEEELSRFLSILLRTFDDLGYRQEQRLHLELGLLKLVHAQRLIPIEEILSQLGTAPPPKSAPSTPSKPSTPTSSTPAASSPRASSPAPTNVAAVHAASPPAAPASPPAPRSVSVPPQPRAAQTSETPSPEADQQKPTGKLEGLPAQTSKTQPGQIDSPSEPTPAPSSAISTPAAPLTSHFDSPSEPTPAPSSAAIPFAASDNAPAKPSPTLASSDAPQHPKPVVPFSNGASVDLQAAVVAALMNTKGQTSAAEQLEEATWTLDGNTLQIQTTLSKTMLPVLVNAEADKIIRSTLREHGPAGLAFKLLPGTPTTNGAAAKKPRPAQAGSAAELAENHPLVQEARRLFSADISNVIDLREK